MLKEFEIALSSSVTSRTKHKAMENASTVQIFMNAETTGEQTINLYMNIFACLGVVKQGSS